MNDVDCKAEFRQEKSDIPMLAEVLRLPDNFRYEQGTLGNGIEGLRIWLKRLAYPVRLSDMIPRFGRPVSEMSMILNAFVDYSYQQHSYNINGWSDTIPGAALHNCSGFVDGTVRPICHPDKNERCVYNGHKRVHSNKFQSGTLPSGIVAQML